MTIRHTIISGLATALLATGLAAATSAAATSTAATPAATTQHRATPPVPTTATVTADQLGPDSSIAVVTHGRFEKLNASGLARSLEVITPDGVRHPVYSVQVEESRRGWFLGDFLIADWRPELHTALLRVSLGKDGDKLVAYDVVTGATKELPAPQRGATFGLAPDGSGVLMTAYGTEHRNGRVATVTWDGVRRSLPARGDGTALTSIDGATLVTADQDRWWVTDLTTRTSTAIDTPGLCLLRRWLDADSVLATCGNRRGSQLRSVDLDGTSSPLGVRHALAPRDGVFDDGDVRVVQGRSWFESFDGCGGAFLTRQTAAGKVRHVRVPGLDGPLTLVGTRGDDLVITHEKPECDSVRQRAALTLFDPVTKAETVLTRLGRDQAWRGVFAANEVRSWIS
ncbi:MAG TPA: hypothetical protein VGD39_18795 [Nocardioides sp.]